MANDQTAKVAWQPGDVPVAARFDEAYFSRENGLAETRHTFLAGNDLPARLRDGFHVAELGFGTGLNMLALAAAWQEARDSTGQGRARVRFTSFEAWPMSGADIARALAPFDALDALARPFLAAWAQGARRFAIGGLDVEVIIGDVAQTLPAWPDQADAWFLDGFSPAKNPEMWSEVLLREVGAHTAPSGSFATFTAAGHVRRALAAAGFAVERRAGYGRKRHMSIGRLANAR